MYTSRVRRFFWIAPILAALLVAPSALAAETDAPKDRKQRFSEERCSRINERIDNRIGKFDESRSKHVTTYTNLRSRLQKFVDRAAADGQDVKQLRADLLILDGKIRKFTVDYQLYAAKLRESKSFTCGHAEGDFREKLSEARQQLKVVHEDAADIRSYYRETIREDLKALRASPSPTPGGTP